MAQVVGQFHEFVETKSVALSEEFMLDWGSEKGGDVVPVFLDGLFCALLVHIPELLYLVGEDVKLLIVGVFFKRGLSLEAVNDKLEADLGILHANCHVLFEEIAETFPAEPHPFLI